MIQQDGYIVYSLLESPTVTHIKEVCDVEHFDSHLIIYVNDEESFPGCFIYVKKADKWCVTCKDIEGKYKWKEFEGTVLAFEYSIHLV